MSPAAARARVGDSRLRHHMKLPAPAGSCAQLIHHLAIFTTECQFLVVIEHAPGKLEDPVFLVLQMVGHFVVQFARAGDPARRAAVGILERGDQFVDLVVFGDTVAGLILRAVDLHQRHIEVSLLGGGMILQRGAQAFEQFVATVAVTLGLDEQAKQATLNIMVGT